MKALVFLDFLPHVSVIRNVEVIRGEVAHSESDLHDHKFMRTTNSADSPAEVFLLSV